MVGNKGSKKPVVVSLAERRDAAKAVPSQGRRRAIGGLLSAEAGDVPLGARDATVYSFNTGKVVPPNKGKSGNSYPFAASSGMCADLLSEAVSHVGERLTKLLAVPQEIYIRQQQPPLISNEMVRDAATVAIWLVHGGAIPSKFPSYGIVVNSRGENQFCTLVDMRRKIIACACVRTMQGGQGHWDEFETAIMRAVTLARKHQQDGRDFNFVLAKDSSLRTY
ncbi:MAG: hypothetical protein ABII71_02315 [Candidatus Micrarchaeota archaeon]